MPKAAPPPAVRNLITLALIAALAPPVALAELKEWDGLGSDNRWLTVNNWNLNGVPTASDDVKIAPTSESTVEFKFDPTSEHFDLLMLAEEFDVRVARTIEVGTGTKTVTVNVDPYAIFALANLQPPASFVIGSKGIINMGGPGMIAPVTFPEGGVAVSNHGALQILAPLEASVLIKGSYTQSVTGRIVMVMPSVKPSIVNTSNSLDIIGLFNIQGGLEVLFVPPFPTAENWPTTRGLNDHHVYAMFVQPLHSDFDVVTVNGKAMSDGKLHPKQPNGTFDGDIIAEFDETANGVEFRAAILGDMNGDGVLNSFDVSPFELALADPLAYAAMYPDIDADFVGDINNSGSMDAFDVAAFEQLLANQGFLINPQVFLRMLERLLVQ